jgi:outer membrane lipoprotein-sorting protein
VLYIEKATFLPLFQKMYDEKGLFSQYEFYNLELNAPIAPEEFTRNYKGYSF